MIKILKTLITCSTLFLTSIPFAETIQCTVIDVYDGSSFTCLTAEKQQVRASLYQVTAPELGQEYGLEAKNLLSDMLLNRSFQAKVHGKNAYKQTTISLYSMGSDYIVDIGNSMISEGYAWYLPLGEKNYAYLRSQKIAKQAKRGLWSQPNPIPPWTWRKQNGKK